MMWGVSRISRDQTGVSDEIMLEITRMVPCQAHQFVDKDRIDPTILNALRAHFDPMAQMVPIVWQLVGMDFRFAPQPGDESKLTLRLERMAPSTIGGEDRPQGWIDDGTLARLGVFTGLITWLEE